MQIKLTHLTIIAVVVTTLTVVLKAGGAANMDISFTAPPEIRKQKIATIKELKAVNQEDLPPPNNKHDPDADTPEPSAVEMKRTKNKEEVVVVKKGDGDDKEGGDLLLPFIDSHDETFSTRCKATVPPLGSCPDKAETVTNSKDVGPYPLRRGILTGGPTTAGMKVIEVEGGKKHHPIFDKYAAKTWTTKFVPNRVMEFVGVHTDYSYDCENHVASGDFRSYHQVRAALCNEHEANQAQSEKDSSLEFSGMVPIVDEEYMEYMMTLTTAWDAATKSEGKGYTFIELGARYGTWIVRAGAAFNRFLPATAAADENSNNNNKLQLMAVEGNCEWFQKMHEHVNCNGFKDETDLILAYAAPRSYNEFVLSKPKTHSKGRAVSLLDMLPRYDVVDMMDLDIQGFEWLAISEPGVFELLTEKVAFLHFGTHSVDIEKRLLNLFQKPNSGWCVMYMYNGAHSKKLNKGVKCDTPYGPSLFNDGSLGIANTKFYPQVGPDSGKCINTGPFNGKRMCFHNPMIVEDLFLRGR